jgi:hypothetical protein
MDPNWFGAGFTALGFLFSLLSFYVIIRATRKQTQSATYSAIMGRLLEINRLEVEKPHLFEILYEDYNTSTLDRGGAGLSHYLFMVMNLYAEIHLQHTKYGLFDEEQFRIWQSRLENDFSKRAFLRGYWRSEVKNFPNEYTKSFAGFVDAALTAAEKSQQLDQRPAKDSGALEL